MHLKSNFHLPNSLKTKEHQRNHHKRPYHHHDHHHDHEKKGEGFLQGVNNPFGGNYVGGKILPKRPEFNNAIPALNNHIINNLKDIHLDFTHKKKRGGIKI